MQLCDAIVVAFKKRKEIFGQVMLVAFAQATDDSKIYRYIFWLLRVGRIDKNVARVHIGVKKIVPENLFEKYINTILGQPSHICVQFMQFVYMSDGYAADSLHDHDIEATIVPMDLWYMQKIRVFKITS